MEELERDFFWVLGSIGLQKKKLKNLKYVDLSYSQNLVGISHLGEAINIEELILQGCKNLVILPSTLYKLKRLKSLVLSGCSKFKKLPEEIWNLECLEKLLLNGTAVAELPPSIQCLKNLKNLSFGNSSSQSPTSIFQSLFQLRKCRKTTSSLLLAPIWGLTSLICLDLTDCKLLDGAIPGDVGSLFSLKAFHLGGNNFENLPSLVQLSQLTCLKLNRCKMLRELPELPLRLKNLFANDCLSLRVTADRFAMCKIEHVWFQNCRKLLNDGENEIVASTLLQQNLQGNSNDFYNIGNVILPGRVIPEFFCNHTFTGHSVSLKLPQNWYYDPEFKMYSFLVILEVINKVKSCNYSGSDNESNDWLCLMHDGPVTDVGVELSFTKLSHDHSINKRVIYSRVTDNMTVLEHTIMGYNNFYPWCNDCRFYEHGKIKVGIRSLRPDIVAVKEWGVRLILNDDDDEAV
ncbi:hypothetical protein LguiA_007209 [Lonicera macranthoides]